MVKSHEEKEIDAVVKESRGCSWAMWTLVIGVVGWGLVDSYFRGKARVEEAKTQQYEQVKWMIKRGYISKPVPYSAPLKANTNGGWDLPHARP